MSVEKNALLIDCRSLESRLIPFNNDNISIVIINSNVKHQLVGSEYSTRRQQCQNVATILNKSLRDATIDELNGKFIGNLFI
jgi:galactokinase